MCESKYQTMNMWRIHIVLWIFSKGSVCCPPDWHQTPAASICYYFSSDEKDFEAAQQWCFQHDASILTWDQSMEDAAEISNVLSAQHKGGFWTAHETLARYDPLSSAPRDQCRLLTRMEMKLYRPHDAVVLPFICVSLAGEDSLTFNVSSENVTSVEAAKSCSDDGGELLMEWNRLPSQLRAAIEENMSTNQSYWVGVIGRTSPDGSNDWIWSARNVGSWALSGAMRSMDVPTVQTAYCKRQHPYICRKDPWHQMEVRSILVVNITERVLNFADVANVCRKHGGELLDWEGLTEADKNHTIRTHFQDGGFHVTQNCNLLHNSSVFPITNDCKQFFNISTAVICQKGVLTTTTITPRTSTAPATTPSEIPVVMTTDGTAAEVSEEQDTSTVQITVVTTDGEAPSTETTSLEDSITTVAVMLETTGRKTETSTVSPGHVFMAESSQNERPIGAYAGGVAGFVVVVFIVGITVYAAQRKKKKKKSAFTNVTYAANGTGNPRAPNGNTDSRSETTYSAALHPLPSERTQLQDEYHHYEEIPESNEPAVNHRNSANGNMYSLAGPIVLEDNVYDEIPADDIKGSVSVVSDLNNNYSTLTGLPVAKHITPAVNVGTENDSRNCRSGILNPAYRNDAQTAINGVVSIKRIPYQRAISLPNAEPRDRNIAGSRENGQVIVLSANDLHQVSSNIRRSLSISDSLIVTENELYGSNNIIGQNIAGRLGGSVGGKKGEPYYFVLDAEYVGSQRHSHL